MLVTIDQAARQGETGSLKQLPQTCISLAFRVCRHMNDSNGSLIAVSYEARACGVKRWEADMDGCD